MFIHIKQFNLGFDFSGIHLCHIYYVDMYIIQAFQKTVSFKTY